RRASGQLALHFVRDVDGNGVCNFPRNKVRVSVPLKNLHKMPGERAMSLFAFVHGIGHGVQTAGCENPSRFLLVEFLNRGFTQTETAGASHKRSTETRIDDGINMTGRDVG